MTNLTGVLGALALGALLWPGQRGSAGYVPAVNSGDRAFGDHRYNSAAYFYRYALEWDAKGVAAHVGLGNVYLKTGKRERAIDEFGAALRTNPHSSEAERGMHDARTEGEESMAFDELAKQVEQQPNNADILTTYAEALIDRDRYDEAKKLAEKALSIDAKEWHAYCALGRIAAKESNIPEARKRLVVAVTHDGTDDDAISTIGDIEMKTKNYASAVLWYRRLVKLLPDEREGHEKLAGALEASGDTKGAEAERDIAKKIQGQEAGGGI